MIPGAFSYHRPATVADAIKLLADLATTPVRWPAATASFP